MTSAGPNDSVKEVSFSPAPRNFVMSYFRPLITCVTLCVAGSFAFAQPPAAVSPIEYNVGGVVRDGRGNPLDNAEVALLSGGIIRLVVQSAANGQFTLGNFSAGKATLQIRHIGYEQLNMNINIGADRKPTFTEIVLEEVPQKLEEVLVKSDEKGRLREFAEHKAVPNNFGHYFDRSDIRKKNPTYASEMLRTVGGVQIQASSFGGNAVRIRGCRPLLWMDGQRIPGAELDEVARPSDIAGMEFYASNAGIPAEFMDRNNGACGIIVVWSKSQ
ncbi:MAG TPA: carboxypeptidase regulatory-like domain-containing protein [Gemmatimonadaceae bacterium]|nr:carboxypeptidase regulatory-like domain-containing protein [Gemmatimonadaceae bacterium]